MSLVRETPRLYTLEDLLAIPEEQRCHEIIDGDLVRKALPSFEHGDAQSALASMIKGPFQLSQKPGGWWISTEVEVQLAPDQVYRPDIVGWRRERVPERPRGAPVPVRPDWICEVLSPTNAGTDRVKKLNRYHQFGVPHYWIVDPMDETLAVYRWATEGYLTVLAAQRGDIVRAEPFVALQLPVRILFGDALPADQLHALLDDAP